MAEPFDRVKVRSLRGRRQVVQANVVDYTTTQQAYRSRGFGHGKVSWLRVGLATKPSHQEAIPANTHAPPASAGSFNPKNHKSAKVAPDQQPGPNFGFRSRTFLYTDSYQQAPTFGVDHIVKR